MNQGCDLDDFDYHLHENVIVMRDFSAVNFSLFNESVTPSKQTIFERYGLSAHQKGNKWWAKNVLPALKAYKVGIGLAPFVNTIVLKEHYLRPFIARDHSEDETKHFLKQVEMGDLEEFVKNRIVGRMIEHISACNHKLLIGHYYLHGCFLHKYSREPHFATKELMFSRTIIPEKVFDFIGFGHNHMPQTIPTLPNAWHIGTLDRENFGERTDKRQYLVYDLETKEITPISLNADADHPEKTHLRPMLEIKVEVPSGIVDIVEYVCTRGTRNRYY